MRRLFRMSSGFTGKSQLLLLIEFTGILTIISLGYFWILAKRWFILPIYSQKRILSPSMYINYIDLIQGEQSRSELMAAVALKHRNSFIKNYLKPALESGLIEMTIPDKPVSRLQKYRLTERGKSYKQ